MSDQEMLDSEAPSDMDANAEEKEISRAEKHVPQIDVPSHAVASTTDVNQPYVAEDPMGREAKADGQMATNGNDCHGTGNATQIGEKDNSMVRDETSVDTKPVEITNVATKAGNGGNADSVAGDETTGLVKNVNEASDVPKGGDCIVATVEATEQAHLNEMAGHGTCSEKNLDNEAANNSKLANTGVEGSVGKSNDGSFHVDSQLGASSPLAPVEVMTSKPKAENAPKWKTWLLDDDESREADEAGTLEEQLQFIKEVESFHKEHYLEFKAPKFYGQPLNCLKLWRAVIKLGGYDVVTASKLWRQVGESFHPPKTCTTVSWTFRIFYEKALLEYEKFLRQSGGLHLSGSSLPQPSSIEREVVNHPSAGQGRARRDAAARAMQGWHAQRFLGYGEVTEPIIKDKSSNATLRREKNLRNLGLPKQKAPSNLDLLERPIQMESDKQMVGEVIDVGIPADWVKINLQETKDCFEVYALVPGLLREEVRVQSDPAGRLVITGQPEQLDNPWGVTPFKKVVRLPARIDPLHTSAVVSLHGQLFIRVPFEQ